MRGESYNLVTDLSDEESYVWSDLLTPGAPNQIPDENVILPLVISEILPNPSGDESKKEFIEIYNRGNTAAILQLRL